MVTDYEISTDPGRQARDGPDTRVPVVLLLLGEGSLPRRRRAFDCALDLLWRVPPPTAGWVCPGGDRSRGVRVLDGRVRAARPPGSGRRKGADERGRRTFGLAGLAPVCLTHARRPWLVRPIRVWPSYGASVRKEANRHKRQQSYRVQAGTGSCRPSLRSVRARASPQARQMAVHPDALAPSAGKSATSPAR